MEAEQFAYSMLTRSQRLSHENLRVRDAAYVEGFERWIAQRAYAQAGLRAAGRRAKHPADADAVQGARHGAEEPHRGLADGAVFGGRRRRRRLSPDAPRRARDGRRRAGVRRNDLRVGRRAHHAGLSRPVRRQSIRVAWRRIVDFVHANSDAKIAIQLGHAGAKGSTRRAWDGADLPLERGQLAAGVGIAAAVPGGRVASGARSDARRPAAHPRRFRARRR